MNNERKYKRNIAQLFQDSQKSQEPFVNYAGHAMMHILGGNKPPTDILSNLQHGLPSFTSKYLLKDDLYIVWEIQNKMKMTIKEYIDGLSKAV